VKRPHLGALPKSRDNYQPRSRVSPSDRCRSVIWRKGNGTPAEGDQGATSCAKQGEMGQAHPPRDDFGGIGLTWGPVSAKPLIHEWGVAAGPPSPHLSNQPPQTYVLHQPARDPHPLAERSPLVEF